MLDVFLKILSVMGGILLVLLIAAAVLLLLVLFFPLTYRVSGKKNTEEMKFSVKLNWLFGLFRVRYRYPSPGLLTARLLWFRLLEMKFPPDKDAKEDTKEAEKSEAADGNTAETTAEETGNSGTVGEKAAEETENFGNTTETAAEETENSVTAGVETADEETVRKESEEKTEASGNVSEKFAKIKYTILNIYDKIKKIRKNISYYLSVMQEEDTKQLFAKARTHLAKLLKSVRPRHVKAQILFGTGSPDTTGYVYGAYCMIAPFYGSKFLVTPDFEQAVLEGEFDLSGHVIVFVLLINVLKVAFDRRLHLLIKKLKREETKNGR